MSQTLTPIDGGRKDIVTSTSSPGIYLSKQYVSAFGLQSRPSEWYTSGRPIYDRLPQASGNYKIPFGSDEYDAFVYIPLGESSLGRKSLNVVSSGDNNEFLTIQAGNVVWRKGTIPMNPVIINLEELGMWNTKYLLAYRMYFDDSPRVFQYEVEEFSLIGQDLAVSSSTEDLPGWRYTSDLAFSGIESRPWSNLDPMFPDEQNSAFLEWQFPYSQSLTRLKLRCPSGKVASGSATLFTMVCEDPPEEGEYCQNYSWLYEEVTTPAQDELGFYYEFIFPEASVNKGWRVQWESQDVSIHRILVDGVVSLKRTPEEGVSVSELVAFPENSAPDSIDTGEGGTVRATYCNLALVDVDREFKVSKITDLRQIVSTDYTPISDWLTQPWDDNLSEFFRVFNSYTPLWMNPVSAMKEEYRKLTEKSVEVN